MKEFLNKYIYIRVTTLERVMMHKCALVTDITDTHISLLDDFDNNPYFYRISDIIEIKLSNKIPKNLIKRGSGDGN